MVITAESEVDASLLLGVSLVVEVPQAHRVNIRAIHRNRLIAFFIFFLLLFTEHFPVLILQKWWR